MVALKMSYVIEKLIFPWKSYFYADYNRVNAKFSD